MCYVKILTVLGITEFLRKNFDEFKFLEAEQVVPLETVWKHWKDVGFPDEHLLIIISVGCLVMEKLRSRNTFVSSYFLDEFSQLTARAIELRMYLVFAIIPWSDVVYHYENSSKRTALFQRMVKVITASWNLQTCDLEIAETLAFLVSQFFVDASTDDSVIDEAVAQLFVQCFDIAVEHRRISGNYLELDRHLMCVCDRWMKIEWKYDIIKGGSKRRLRLESAVTWMYNGDKAKENTDEDEAQKCFEKAEECFDKYVPNNDIEVMLYYLKFALFLRLRGRTDEAIENLLMVLLYADEWCCQLWSH